MESTHLYADFMWAIRLTKELQDKRYLFVVRPVDTNEEPNEIEEVSKKICQMVEENSEK